MNRLWSSHLFRSFIHNARATNFRYASSEAQSKYIGSYSGRFPSLSRPLPGLKLPPTLMNYRRRSPTKTTTLPNGLRIASEDSKGPAACIGLFVDCGSVYETEKSVGAIHLLERLAFKSTQNRTAVRVVQDIEVTGGNVATSISREQIAYSYDMLRAYLPEAIELLVDCVRNPLFPDDEVEEQLAGAMMSDETANKDPQQHIIEMLHLAGYHGALGKPLMATAEALDRLNGAIIREFYHENYTADRMVLAAFGVEHDHLVTLAEPLLRDLKRGLPLEAPKSNYIGGDVRHKADLKSTHVALAFETSGGWNHDRDATTLTVLQTLMGGGGSFSSGGPGKGMHSRLYRRVLCSYPRMQSISGFVSLCNTTGLFGIQLTAGSDFVARAVDIAVSELLAIATPGMVSQVELDRAKNATKSIVLTNLESRMTVTEDIGRQFLTYGCRKPVETFLGYLDAITLDDITRLAQNMLTTPLTLASWGDVDCVQIYDTVSRHFRA